MVVGLRVVRGPDWNLGDKDGGKNHVGTITAVKDDNSVEVAWDVGRTTSCRAGQNQKQDLKIFDSGPLGISHFNVGCDGCQETCISGTRWKCAVCKNVNLCTPCYFDDSHNTAHPFLRIDYPGSPSVELQKRSVSQRARALGIYPNAEVTRGIDWEYGDQDGGVGKIGIVEDVVNYGQDLSQRNAVRVRWPNTSTHIYRVGYQGKMDLKYREEAPGADFYPDHLPCIDASMLALWRESLDVLKVGDKVCIDVSKSELRQLQQGRLIWNTRMEEICGEIGVIKTVTLDGDVELDFDGETITVAKGAIAKIPIHSKGDVVRVIEKKEKIQRLQKKHGGWDDGMEEVMGKLGKVTVIDKDGDVGVNFGETGFVFHPSCLVPAPGESVPGLAGDPEIETGEESDDSTEEEKPIAEDTNKTGGKEGEEEGEDLEFLQLFAGLMLLQSLSRGSATDIRQRFLQSVVQGNDTEVRELLKQNPALKDLRHNNLPILSIAAHQGHIGTARALLDAGTDIDIRDEKNNTPLIVAMMAEKGDMARFLIERGANVNSVNMHKRTPLHVAAHKNMAGLLKIMIDKGSDPNAQDVLGDTPLHDAISERHDSTADLLIQLPATNVWLKNTKLFNPMAFACLKAHAHAVDKLISREPRLVSAKETTATVGFYPLHIAAVNNHVNEANILIIKGRASVNARNDHDVTPLHLAASEGYYDMAKLLLTYEADWTLTESDGNTPLHLCLHGRRTDGMFLQLLGLRNLAEDTERVKIANLLIQHGASLQARNNKGLMPLEGCTSQLIKDAVTTYAENNKPTKPEPRQKRPKTAKAEQQMFQTSTQKCHKCSVNLADTRFLPCRDQVACQKCCFKYKRCPVCDKEINKRVDKNNQPIAGDSCTVS